MFTLLLNSVIAISVVSILWILYQKVSKFHVLMRKIPGPAGLPLIGNAWDLYGSFDCNSFNVLEPNEICE